MKKFSFAMLSILSVMFFANCGGGSTDSTSAEKPEEVKSIEINLTEKGIPVTITAPEGVEVAKGMGWADIDGVTYYDWEIKKGNFNLCVSMFDEVSEISAVERFQELKDIDAEDDGFVGFLKEEETGAIYKTEVDGEVNHSFTYVKEKDGKMIEFAPGFIMDNLSLEEVEALYEAAKNSKI